MTSRRWAIAALVATLMFDVWLRGHTVAGTVRDRFGFAPWPVVAEAEPLDCDEAIYAYIGKRITRGDVMYRDLTDTKSPLGYWLTALAVAIGGANETCIRLMPLPMVLLTIGLVWSIAYRIGGPVAASLACAVYALMSTDPYLYGNGADMEHALNLLGTAALGMAVRSWSGSSRRAWVFVGILVGSASLVKQVAFVPIGIVAVALMLRQSQATAPRTIGPRLADLSALLAGFAAPWGVALGVLVLQGAGLAAYEDIVRYGGALATDTPPDPLQYSFLVRMFVGNTDPQGILPWPFGKTLGRAWWAAGSWPLWAVSIPAIIWAVTSRRVLLRLAGALTLGAWVQVAMPRLFWQHYYLLPVPGVAIVVGSLFASAVDTRRPRGLAVVGIVLAATIGTIGIQVRDYLLVKPNDITTRYKGGGQWVVLREVGRELKHRTLKWDDPHLVVWGIQSPVTFYSGLDNVTRQVFIDPLLMAYPTGGHPQVDPRLERTIVDLRARRPEFIFIGARPFPALARLLGEEYENVKLTLPLPVSPLWVRRDLAVAFAATSGR
jgi:4-amino-4-deoxy-L-arabinose transferase-like glycosyltransferase